MDGSEAVARGLDELMRDGLDGGSKIQVEGLHRISEGLSRENWTFEGSWVLGGELVRRPLILRRDPEGSLLETDRQLEFDVLHKLESAPLPTPRALWMDRDGRWLGRPGMVMIREPGECDWFVLNGSQPLEERVALGRDFVTLLGQIHLTDWKSLGLDEVLDDPGPAPSLTEVARWQDQLRRNQLEAHPELDLTIEWLTERAPSAQSTVLVHGDFKPGNVLLQGTEISAMLDWELAHLGDPLEDLGWVTNPYRSREHQIDGAWERQQIVEQYVEVTGFEVDPDELLWWNVFSCFKLSTIILNGVAEFVNGHFDVIYQAPMSLYRVMFDLMDGKTDRT